MIEAGSAKKSGCEHRADAGRMCRACWAQSYSNWEALAFWLVKPIKRDRIMNADGLGEGMTIDEGDESTFRASL